MNKTRTEAGRRLLDQITPPVNEAAAPEEAWVANSWARRNDIEDAIIAIEAEARAQGALHERLISEGEEAARTADRPSLRAAAEYALDAMVRQGWDGSAIPRLTQSVAALRQALEAENR